MVGKKVRMERIINRETGRTVIVPMDHGVTVGPIAGLIDIRESVTMMVNGGANHRIGQGIGALDTGAPADVGLIVHMSAGTRACRRTQSGFLSARSRRR